MGNGKRPLELIASGLAGDFSPLGQLLQGGAEDRGAHAAELAQLLERDRGRKSGQSLADSLQRSRWRRGRRDGPFQHGES